MKPTFKQFLLEVDIGDHQLQQQAELQRRQTAADDEARGGFGKKMASASPQKGDVIAAGNVRYIVLGGSMEGIKAKQLGGESKTISVPHGTKFKNMGQSRAGKTVFAIIK